MFKRLTGRRPVSLVLTFLIIASIGLHLPMETAGKTRARSTASSKARAKSKVRRGKSGRSARGRVARGRGRARYKMVKVRGRNGRWVWKRRALVARASRPTGVGVHNYLTNAWTSAQDPTIRESGPANTVMDANGGTTMSAPANQTPAPGEAQPVAATPANGAVTTTDAIEPGDEVRPRQVTPTMTDVPAYNPLVAAYTESLDLRGISSESQGFIVATMQGEVLAAHNADRLFNPASVTKVATTLTAISRLGPDFRFRTSLYTDGTFEPSTGTLRGSLYVVGSGDPAFFAENAMLIADKLNRSGIRHVEGDLYVLGQFYFNFSASREASAKAFRSVLTTEGLTGLAKSAHPRFVAMRAAEDRAAVASGGKRAPALYGPPTIKITGQTITDPAVNTTRLTLLAVHTSLPLLRLLKGLNDFSNNWMASMIGGLVGGPDAVERFLKTDVGFRDDEVNFATSSGLGANSISPRSTVTLLRKLITYLNAKGLGLEDILPIAGVDGGTLQRRFTDAFRGSVVAKTGTLSSVSALAGVAFTRGKGPLVFVIYNQGRSSSTFRPIQDEIIRKVITLYGGPAPVRSSPNFAPRVTEQGAEGSGAAGVETQPSGF